MGTITKELRGEIAIAEVNGVLLNIRTDKQCREQWPEIMPIVEKLMPEPKVRSTPPSILREDLNVKLNLLPKINHVGEPSAIAA